MIQNVGPTKFDSEVYFGIVVGLFCVSVIIFYVLSRNASDNVNKKQKKKIDRKK